MPKLSFMTPCKIGGIGMGDVVRDGDGTPICKWCADEMARENIDSNWSHSLAFTLEFVPYGTLCSSCGEEYGSITDG